MCGDPLKVEVKFRPQCVGDPCAVLLLRLREPFSIFKQDRGAEGRSVFKRGVSFTRMWLPSQSRKPLTSSWRADSGVFVLDGFEMNIKHGLLDATCVHVSSEADHLLCPDERMCQVVCHGAKACVAKYGQFVQPRVIYEAGIAQPVDRILGVVGIRDDRCNDTDLRGRMGFVISYDGTREGGGEETYIGAGFWTCGIVE